MRDFLLSVPPALSGGPDRDVFIQSFAEYRRNLDGAPFPRRASRSDADEARGRVLSALREDTLREDTLREDTLREDGAAPLVLRIGEATADESAALVERGFAEAAESRDEGGRSGRALAILGGGDSCLVNGADHLRLAAVRSGLSPEVAFAALRAWEMRLDERLGFAATSGLGYLTARPEDCGAALRLGASAFLPGIAAAGLFERVSRELLSAGIEPRAERIGTEGEGEPSALVGPCVSLSARAPLGADEDEFVVGFLAALRGLAEGERKIRERLLPRERLRFEDASYRAAGLLGACRLLGAGEALRLLATLRTAAVYGLGPAVEGGIDPTDAIDAARTLALPAHARLLTAKKKLQDEEAVRSELVRGLLPRYLI